MPNSISSPNIVFLDRNTIPKHIQIPQLPIPHQLIEYDQTDPKQLIERIQKADIVITNKVVLNENILKQAPNIKMIAVSATGFNNIDIDYCKKAGIAVTNVSGYSIQSVPEHALAMIFALRRHLVAYRNDILDGKWQQENQFCFFNQPIIDISGSTIGIIGSGSLGKSMATLSRAVGMKVIFAERKGQTICREGYLPFDDVLKQADVISLHCPLNDETHHLIDNRELSLMKPTSILINLARGGVVNELALADALLNHQIAGCGCDVFCKEPAGEENPLIRQQKLPNLLLTPHVAWGSDEALKILTTRLIDNIKKFLQGEQQDRIV